MEKVVEGEITDLTKRKISEETCRHFGYMVGSHRGKPVHIAPYHDRDGNLIAQKLRTPDKAFSWVGDPTEAMPFGYHASAKAGRILVVTEGEIDAMTVAQIQGLKYPVWSIACGAGPQIKKYIAKHREAFNQFEKVVFMFDADEKGREAARIACEIVGAKAWMAELPGKDANELLVTGRTEELVKAFWNPVRVRPQGIVDMATMKDAVKERPTMGLSTPWASLTEIMYGFKPGRVVGLGGGTGIGKSDVFAEFAACILGTHQEKIAGFFLESTLTEITSIVIGKLVNKRLHIPNAGWTDADLDRGFETLGSGRAFLYDSFGSHDWEPIKEKIEFLYHTEDVKWFFLDHLTALASAADDEKRALEQLMAELAGLVKKIPITVFFISHLSTPDGTPHEEGGRVSIKHFKGSRSIGFWATELFGLERNQQAEDEQERYTTTVRCLKNRTDGSKVGDLFYLRYNFETGRLEEVDSPTEQQKYAAVFKDEDDKPNGLAKAGPSDF